MFSSARAITSGAIVFAIGGVLLVSQPFDQQSGSVLGAEAAAAPVAFTGTGEEGPCPVNGTEDETDSVLRVRGGYCNPVFTSSDPRFRGTVTWAGHEDEYLDDSELWVGVVSRSIVNDEGAWRMLPIYEFAAPDVTLEFDVPQSQDIWVGEGGYEGLFAVLAWDDAGFEGYIVEGELPPVPQTSTTP